MAAATYQSVLTKARALSEDDRLRLVRELTAPVDHLVEPVSVLDLCGLGADLWQQVDAQEYVSQERSTWAK
jgi:hypothetical protein